MFQIVPRPLEMVSSYSILVKMGVHFFFGLYCGPQQQQNFQKINEVMLLFPSLFGTISKNRPEACRRAACIIRFSIFCLASMYALSLLEDRQVDLPTILLTFIYPRKKLWMKFRIYISFQVSSCCNFRFLQTNSKAMIYCRKTF